MVSQRQKTAKTALLQSLAAAMAGGAGSAAAMVYADLPEGPSLQPYLAALVLMTTATGLYVGLGQKKKAGSIMIGLVLGQIVGVEVVVFASLLPLEPPFEQVLGALSLGGTFFGGLALAVGLTLGTGSVALGRWLGARLGSRTRDTKQ